MSEPTSPRDELVALLKENQYGIVAVEPEHLADVLLAAGYRKIHHRLLLVGDSIVADRSYYPLPTAPNENLQQIIYTALYNGGATFDRDTVVPALEHAILEHLKETR